jgi:hypothetical protein
MTSFADVMSGITEKWEDSRVVAMIYAEDPIEHIREIVYGRILMIQESLPMNNVWRVKVNPDDTYILNDFTMPSQSDTIEKLIPKDEVPKWVLEQVSVLQIAENDTTVDGVGKKISGSIFYIFEPMNEG